MDDGLSTPANLLGALGTLGPVMKGELTLSEGVLTFTRPGAQDPLFRVPAAGLQARRSGLLGLGLKLTARGETYRIWFVELHSGGFKGIRWGFYGIDWEDFGPARSVTQTWRAALSGTGT